jgi:hypothetical protein
MDRPLERQAPSRHQWWQNSEAGAVEGAADVMLSIHDAFHAPDITTFFTAMVTAMSQRAFLAVAEEVMLWFISVFAEYFPYFLI